MEKLIGEDETDDRAEKMKERFDHYLAQQVAEGDDRVGSAQDPRQGAQEQVPTQNLMIWIEAVEMTRKNSTSGVQQKMKEVKASWTRMPMRLTTAPASLMSDA